MIFLTILNILLLKLKKKIDNWCPNFTYIWYEIVTGPKVLVLADPFISIVTVKIFKTKRQKQIFSIRQIWQYLFNYIFVCVSHVCFANNERIRQTLSVYIYNCSAKNFVSKRKFKWQLISLSLLRKLFEYAARSYVLCWCMIWVNI